MQNREIQPAQHVQASELAADTPIFIRFLADHGLPTDNVIAEDSEREIITNNLSTYLSGLPEETKRDARYLAKFAGASAVGLFDAALNYIWNEVVLTLRNKIEVYGVDLFFDAAVGGKAREQYKDARDLDGIKDIVMLDTCSKLEIVSDIVYKKLIHILTMRNEVAASHPNVASIGGFELMGFLQTAVTEVINDQLSPSAIRVKSFLNNLKGRNSILENQEVADIKSELANLSTVHSDNLLVSVFGVYVAPDSAQILRKNVSLISPELWKLSSKRAKFRIGQLVAGYQVNLDEAKVLLGNEYLEHVGGLSFLPASIKISRVNDAISRLRDAHHGYDNYYHEPPIMKEILSHCPTSSDLSPEFLPQLVSTVLRCRLGRGISYRNGVSPGGLPLYDQMFAMFDDNAIIEFINAVSDHTVLVRLENSTCLSHYIDVLAILRPLPVSDRLGQALDMLISDPKATSRTIESTDFRDIMLPYSS